MELDFCDNQIGGVCDFGIDDEDCYVQSRTFSTVECAGAEWSGFGQEKWSLLLFHDMGEAETAKRPAP